MAVPSTWPRLIAAAGGAHWPIDLFNDEPFEQVFTIEGVDYAGASFSGNIRAAFEESSAVLASFSFAAALVEADTILKVALSENVVEALRSGFDPGAIETLYYSIKCTPAGGKKTTWFAGEFRVMGA